MPDESTLASLRVSFTVEYDPRLGAPPPVELRIGGTSPAVAHVPGTPASPSAPAAAPASRLPPVPWEAPPHARAAFFPAAPDEGQHEIWKKEAALVVFRYLAGPDLLVARAWFDLDGAAPSAQPALFPLHTDLLAACKRLGFRRLFRAALGFDSEQPPGACAPVAFPAGGGFRLFAGASLLSVRVPALTTPIDVDAMLRDLVEQHGAASALAVERAKANEEQRKAAHNPANGPFVPMSEEEYVLFYAIADKSSPDGWERPELAGCPPLRPLRIAHDPLAVAPEAPRRTPATGAAIPEVKPPDAAPVPGADANTPPSSAGPGSGT